MLGRVTSLNSFMQIYEKKLRIENFLENLGRLGSLVKNTNNP